MAGGRGARPTRVLTFLLVLGVLAAVAAPSARAVPAAVEGLAVDDESFQTVNITFNASASPDVDHYVIYVSGTNATTVSGLTPAPGQPGTVYDLVYVTSPANASRMAEYTGLVGYFAFENATSGGWARGRISAGQKFVSSDASRVFYSLTGLRALETHYIAVTPVDSADAENENITTVEAVPKAAPVERLPGNEGILLSLGGIMLALAAAFVVLWRRSGPASRPAYSYVAPAIVALAVLTFYPTAVGFVLSFTDRTLTSGQGGFDFDFIGVDNYVRVFERPEFALVAATTIVWTVVNVFFHVAVGLVLAVLLDRKILGRPVYRTLFLLPWAIPSYISVLAWRGMFDLGGVIDHGFRDWLGLPIDWLGTMPAALVAVITTNVWLGIPFMMMVFSGGLQGIPPELYEAADVDGLSRWQKFRRITLPLLRPTIVPASLLGFIWTFNMFNVIYLMTQGRPTIAVDLDAGATDILITYVYREGFQPFWRQGFAAAYSVVIFLMLLVFSLSYTRYTRAVESFAGEAVSRERGRIARAIDGAAMPLRRWVVDPVRRAISPDQPETIDFPFGIALVLLALGVLEFAYGWTAVAAMGPWNTLTATHGFGFTVLGLLLLASALLLAAGRTSGRRLATWSGIFHLLAGVVAPMWLGVPLLMVVASIAGLVLVTRPWPQPAPRPARLAASFERVGSAGAALVAAIPHGRGARLVERGLLHAFLISFAIWSVFPLLMVVGTSFSNINSLSTVNIPFIGPALAGAAIAPVYSWDAFVTVTRERPFLTWLMNSVIVSAGTTIWGLFIALRAGYGFSRFHFTGKGPMMLSFLIVQMFPGAIILIPYYLLMQQLRLLNNPIGLILAYSVTALPFMVWMLKGFFDTIPKDLEEAAMVDGCSRGAAFRRVILPLSLPALAVTALFSFLSAWNEWLLAFTFLSQERNFTLPVGISSLVQPPNIFWNEYAALALIVSIPVVFLFILFQRFLISGLTKGAVKG